MEPALELAFLFVPDGAPVPRDWLAAHPDFLIVPARIADDDAPPPVERSR